MNKSAHHRPPATVSQFATVDGGNLLAHLSHKGNQLLKQGDVDKAEQAYLEILELETTNSFAWIGLARIARKRGDLTGAEHFYQQCLATAPYNRFALIGLADCYRAGGRLPQALEVWKKCLSLDEKDLSVLTRMADAYRKSRRFEHALEMYQRALTLDPQHVYALIGLGYLHYELKDYPKALLRWILADQVQPGHTDLRLLTNLGNCYRKLNQFEIAIPYFQRVLSQDGSNFYGLFGLADSYRGLHQATPSLACWNAILAQQPDNKIVLTRAGDALRQLGRLDEAQTHYQRALDIGPDVYARMGLALIAKHQRRFGQAVGLLEQVMALDPDNSRAPWLASLVSEGRQLAANATLKK